MDKMFTMSQFSTKEELYKAKCTYLEEQLKAKDEEIAQLKARAIEPECVAEFEADGYNASEFVRHDVVLEGEALYIIKIYEVKENAKRASTIMETTTARCLV